MLAIICIKKNYVAPNQSEGLDEVIQIEFTPKFDSEGTRENFSLLYRILRESCFVVVFVIEKKKSLSQLLSRRHQIN